jgi:hypothetical protein
MQEIREFPQTHGHKPARVIATRCRSLIGCPVLHLSMAGAVIAVANAADIPDELELTFDAAYSMRPCRVAWRTVHRIGVAFC